jgi:hypothetical protein
MAKKIKYRCVLFEQGDKVKLKFPANYDDNPTRVVEETRLTMVGTFITQFLAFYDVPDVLNVSNQYEPAEETIEKYKSGLIYYDENPHINKSIKPKTSKITRQPGMVERTLFNSFHGIKPNTPNNKEVE